MIEAQGVTSHPPVAKDRLLRILGLSFGLAVTVGGTIGVSIFRLPGPIAALLGVPWLIMLIWLLGGMYTLLSANYTAELATMLPKVGGPYVYAHRAYGSFIGFVVGWTSWLGEVAALSFLSIALGEYVVALLPQITGASPMLVAYVVLLLLTGLNWLGLRSGSLVQKLTSFVKALALLVFIVICFIYGNGDNGVPAAVVQPQTTTGLLLSVFLSFQLVLGAYGGWNTAVYFSEEDTNPSHNIPRSLHYGALLVIVIYLLVNLALLYVLPMATLAASPLAAADAMRLVIGERSGQVLTIIAIISILGIINALLLFMPRVLFALGRDGLFTPHATRINKRGTPVVALVVSALASICLIAFGSFETLLAVYTFYGVFNNILLVGALFVLRKKEPGLPRPFKTWAYPIAPLVLLLISMLLFVAYVISDTRNSIYAIASLAITYPVFKWVRRKA